MPDFPWQPLSCSELASLLADAPFPWWICGGHALDLYLSRRDPGHVGRPHGDVDVGVLRADQPALYARLPAFEIHLAKDGRLTELGPDERRAGLHDPDHHAVWCRPRGARAWSFEVLLNEGDRDTFVYRRAPAVRRPLAEALALSAEGWPILAPELQLLFKAKSGRPKDEADFRQVAPALTHDARSWLAGALRVAHPGHPWIAALQGPGRFESA